MTQLSRFQTALGTTDADAAIISSELNIRYLCGFNYSDGYLLILPDKAYLLADFRYIEAARAAVTEFEVIRPDSDMLTELKFLMNLNQVSTVAIEDASLSCADFAKFKEKFESIQLVTGASEMLTNQRTVKLPQELELINEAQKITDVAFEHILDFITPEKNELEIALELEFFMRGMGAESVAFDTIAVSGRSSSLPHGVPANRRLENGFLTMDFGAKYKGYCSDMTRTVV
ncbi:MAG: aminopeptidase P family protein, partial [Clostridia bacterium]|nr:aminopeptidase P family protein [Clostridia bacterium]